MRLKPWHKVIISMIGAMTIVLLTTASPLDEETRLYIAMAAAFLYPILFISFMRSG